MNNKSILASAQLWTGNTDTVIEKIHSALQELFCPNNNCKSCTSCRNIQHQEHYATMWLEPEKSTYTVEQLDIVFEKIS